MCSISILVKKLVRVSGILSKILTDGKGGCTLYFEQFVVNKLSFFFWKGINYVFLFLRVDRIDILELYFDDYEYNYILFLLLNIPVGEFGCSMQQRTPWACTLCAFLTWRGIICLRF